MTTVVPASKEDSALAVVRFTSELARADAGPEVFDITSLQVFTPHELDHLLCGRREFWEPETLAEHIKFNHGYNAKSPAVANLLEIMGEFTPDPQQAFYQFITGAPRLLPGGLATLNPKLTIVRKNVMKLVSLTLNHSLWNGWAREQNVLIVRALGILFGMYVKEKLWLRDEPELLEGE